MVVLTSTGFTNPNVLKVLMDNRKSKYPNICIIVTGIPEKKNHPIVKNTVNSLRDKIEDICLLDVEIENPSILEKYELILILGGHSAHLFYHLNKSGAKEIIINHVKQNKDIVGASAGAWYLSSGREHSKDFVFLGIDETYEFEVDSKGLGLIDLNLFPHFDMFSNKVDGLDKELKEIEKKRGIQFKRLNNMDFIYKDNNGVIHE